ncbi:MAG: nucleotidyltransferase domain-containing protein [Bacteroidales bacterium]|nr:nucleotidyltransferase domain-containing protein [Bacteroidales bacterium]
MELIRRNMAQIIALCEKYKVRDLYAFGSILTDKFNDKSDVDLVVIFDRESLSPLEYADNYFGLRFALEDLFRREVDLVEYEAIRNPYFKEEVDETKRVIYGQAA